jgi:thiamine biosynthesis lipoprotein
MPSAKAPQLQRFEQSQPHMGTTFRVVLYAPDERSATRGFEVAFARIAQLDAMLSDYRDDSELTRLSRASGGPAVRVSDDLFTVLERSLELSRQTGGAFDVSVGPVVRVWRRARRQRQLPTPQQIADALERTGYSKIKLDPRARSVQMARSGMLLDLGGVAKGFACDQALVALAGVGITRALVDGGGDISVGEAPPERTAWTVAVASPVRPNARPQTEIALVCAAAATSGDTERYFEVDGRRFSHIIDPRTGRALADRRQVTVVAPDGLTADALATAVSVLGAESGLKLVDLIPNAAACVYHVSVSQSIEVCASKHWSTRARVATNQADESARRENDDQQKTHTTAR